MLSKNMSQTNFAG